MKKVFSLLLVVLMTFSMLAGCTSNNNENGNGGDETPADDGTPEIALVCSAAGKNDNGYNQRAIEGLNDYSSKTGRPVSVVETSDSLSVPDALAQLAAAGVKLIFSLEYDFDALISGVGGAEPLAKQYPDTTFVIFNANPNSDGKGGYIHDNVITVLFDVHEGSYLAGYLAVQVNENLEELFDTSAYGFNLDPASNRVMGYIGGNSSEGIFVFTYGFMEGISYAAGEYDAKYNFLSTHDAGFADATIGSTFADSCYTAGANVVYGVAGNVGTGVDSKAADTGRLSIEVDANKDADRPGNILTSVLKNTQVPVQAICDAYVNGSVRNNLLLTYSVASGGAGITDLETISKYIKDDGKAKWEEIKTKLADVQKKMESGEIVVTDAQAGEKLNPAKLENLTWTDGALQ